MQIKLHVALLSIAVVPLFAFVPPRLVATRAKTALSSRKYRTALHVTNLQVRDLDVYLVIERLCMIDIGKAESKDGTDAATYHYFSLTSFLHLSTR